MRRLHKPAMRSTHADQLNDAGIPATLLQSGAPRFWLAVLCTGIGAGVSAIILTRFLEIVQYLVWASSGTHILDAATRAGAWRHILVLLAAGAIVGIGQLVLVRLSSGNGIDITAAIWFSAGRLPAVRTLGSAVLSVVAVGMGASLGREGAPKQAGAVVANLISDKARLSDEQRQLLVACGAGAGMAAAYGVPLGGALFALEVLRGMLALRLVLPALLASLAATTISWLVLPNAPTYQIPAISNSAGALALALIIGPIAGIVAVGYVRTVAWADHNKPTGWQRVGGACARTRSAWLDLRQIPATAWKWQRPLSIALHGRDYICLAADAAFNFEACGDCNVPGKRHAGGLIHPLINIWSFARRDGRLYWFTARGGSFTGTIRLSWRRRNACCHDARTDFGNRAYDGAHGPGQIVHSSSAACRDRSHFGLPHD